MNQKSYGARNLDNLPTDQNIDVALLLLRLGVGIIFIVAGWGKLTGIENVQGFFGGLGIPLPGLMAWVVAIVEFVGGIFVLAGAFIRIPAILLAIIMVVAIITTKIGEPFPAYRVDIMLLVTSATLSLLGSGKYSLDGTVKVDEPISRFFSFLIPIVGLILYLVWKNSKPDSAKSAGVAAIWGVVIGILVNIIILL